MTLKLKFGPTALMNNNSKRKIIKFSEDLGTMTKCIHKVSITGTVNNFNIKCSIPRKSKKNVFFVKKMKKILKVSGKYEQVLLEFL